MRLQEIIGIVREYFFLALIVVTVLGIIFFIGYFIVYRKLFGGKKSLPKKQLLLGGLFTGYVIMVIGVTFLNRGPNFYGMNFSFFSSYLEAWYSFSFRHWQFVILNIFMFVPFGILLPLLHSRFKRALWTIGAALLFTLSIESIQLVTRYGNFVVDDLFNNLLGAIIGYGIIMGFITIKAKGVKRSCLYFSPLFLVVILFGSMFIYYHLKEFGNLSIVSTDRTNMTQATTTIDIQLDDNRTTVPVYMAPSYTKAAADEFVIDFFGKMNLDTSNMEVISYQNEGVYWIRDEISHNIWFRLLDGSYSYKDFSSFDEDRVPKDVDEETIIEELIQFGIHVPQDSLFQKVDTGSYEWAVDKKVIENQLIDGVLGVSYYNDDTVKVIDNHLITYDKVRDVQIKSEQEAYKEISDGKFQHYSENKSIESLHIHKVEVSYLLDSKGYYQPVYAFHSTVDGMKMTIIIAGI
ncbi:VanZ family protein [Halalkalibacter lacteus]|uniref:VanZ family protein n=1 Tax=Halalkalibacter lacteus TaxID=3090663 RepID=UPI002FCAE840